MKELSQNETVTLTVLEWTRVSGGLRMLVLATPEPIRGELREIMHKIDEQVTNGIAIELPGTAAR